MPYSGLSGIIWVFQITQPELFRLVQPLSGLVLVIQKHGSALVGLVWVSLSVTV
jgi:hypothetical protein